jgi:homoserine kinase type II
VDAGERLVISDANCLAWIIVGGNRMIAKWSMRQPLFARLAAIARLTSWLDTRGVPVSAPRPTRDGRVQIEVDGFSLGLQNVVDGELLDITDPVQVNAAGEMLARMHAAMAEYPEMIPVDEPKTEHTQLVGNDFRSANVLWADGRIAAVLDLEEAKYRRRLTTLLRLRSSSGPTITTGRRRRSTCAVHSSRRTSRFFLWTRMTPTSSAR